MPTNTRRQTNFPVPDLSKEGNRRPSRWTPIYLPHTGTYTHLLLIIYLTRPLIMTGYRWCVKQAHAPHNFICSPPSCWCACGRSGLQAQASQNKKMPSHTKPPSSPRIMSQAAAVKLGRSSSRMSSVSRGSSDEEQTKTAVKVGTFLPSRLAHQSRHPPASLSTPYWLSRAIEIFTCCQHCFILSGLVKLGHRLILDV